MTLSLSRLRFVVQVASFVVLVYGGLVIGHYAADKLSTALPALSCAYDQNDGAYCALIPFQHQMHHRVGEGGARAGAFAWDLLVPTAFTFLSFFLFFVVLNKAFCGWLCPLGTLQEMIYRLGRRLGAPARALGRVAVGRLRPVKWALLGGLVFALPVLAGLGYAPHAAGDAFCQICPSRIATTLANGDTSQMGVPLLDGPTAMVLAALRNFLIGFVLVGAAAMRQPFCRICPMLALHASLRRLSPMRLTKRRHDRCDSCGICTKACPMDIPEVWTADGAKAFSEDCTLCGRCVEYCPQDNVLALKWGPLTVAASSRDRYGRTIRRHKPDGTPVPAKPARPVAPAEPAE